MIEGGSKSPLVLPMPEDRPTIGVADITREHFTLTANRDIPPGGLQEDPVGEILVKTVAEPKKAVRAEVKSITGKRAKVKEGKGVAVVAPASKSIRTSPQDCEEESELEMTGYGASYSLPRRGNN